MAAGEIRAVTLKRHVYAGLFADGLTIEQIAEQHSVSEGAVRDGLRRAGVKYQLDHGIPNKLSEVQKAYIAGLIDGEGHVAIANRKSTCGVNAKPIRRYEVYVNISNCGVKDGASNTELYKPYQDRIKSLRIRSEVKSGVKNV